MNRLVLKYATPITIVILAIFAWVVVSRIAGGGVSAIFVLAATATVVWLVGVPLFILLWPRITVDGYRRAIVRRGLGDGPIPVNTLRAIPDRSSGSASGGLLATGADDLLYVVGWLDVRAAPRVLSVPEMAGRYYSIQFTDPVTGANFAYVGKRTTGTAAYEALLCRPGWTGAVRDGMHRVDVPHAAALVVGRVFAGDSADRATAHALATRMRLAPLGEGAR